MHVHIHMRKQMWLHVQFGHCWLYCLEAWMDAACVIRNTLPHDTAYETQLTRVHLHFAAAVQSLSRVWLSATTWTAARQASLSFTISQSLSKLMSIQSVMPSNPLILCRPLLLLPSIFPSIRVFSNESALPKYWSFSFSISPFYEYSGLISFRNNWFDLLAVQGTLKSLL